MSRFLFDENLPSGLVASLGCDGVHATALAAQPTDRQLWDYARERRWVIVTKDADFFDLLALHGSPPKVIWVRTGNLRRCALERLLKARWTEIDGLIADADLVEVHDDRIEAIRF